MHVGIDFDNTIADYTLAFHIGLRKLGIQLPKNYKKQKIRQALRDKKDGELLWTTLQGLIYGSAMEKAEPARGVKDFLRKADKRGIQVSIISHRTKIPAVGSPVNLHKIAFSWLTANGFFTGLGLTRNDVFFESSRESKLTRIRNRHCNCFIDDLLEIFTEKNFPKGVEKIWYSPEEAVYPQSRSDIITFQNWSGIEKYILDLSI
jgi:hypothetical protein